MWRREDGDEMTIAGQSGMCKYGWISFAMECI